MNTDTLPLSAGEQETAPNMYKRFAAVCGQLFMAYMLAGSVLIGNSSDSRHLSLYFFGGTIINLIGVTLFVVAAPKKSYWKYLAPIGPFFMITLTTLCIMGIIHR